MTIKNKKSIAILLATYNAAKYIREQIDSILAQTQNDWTLYIRDDGSKDETLAILEEYRRKNPNIILIRDNLGNLGCRDNFFRMLEIVDSEYYMFSDADDFWLPTKIEDSYSTILRLENDHPKSPILVHTDMSVADRNLNVISKSMWEYGHFNPDKIKNKNYLAIHGFVGGATSIFNKKVKNISMPFSKDVYLHDLWIGLCVIQNGILFSLHKPTMLYRQHNDNIAGASLEKQLSIKYKIKNLRKVIQLNISTAKMLKKIGWGGFFKYIYYKIKLILKIRSGRCM